MENLTKCIHPKGKMLLIKMGFCNTYQMCLDTKQCGNVIVAGNKKINRKMKHTLQNLTNLESLP